MSEIRRLKTLVVDDEATARNGLMAMLSNHPEVEKIWSCSNGVEAIEFLTKNQVDLLFLDIQMPLVDGFDVLRSLQKDKIPYVVFVTAHDEFALKAFEFHAIDYVLKPFSDQRLLETLARVQKMILQQEQSEKLNIMLREIPTSNNMELLDIEANKKLVFKESGVINFLEPAEISWIEAYDYYVKVHLAPKFHLVRTSMKKILQSLDPTQFIRIHKSAIINVDQIKNIETLAGDWTVTLKQGEKLKVGRAYKDNLKNFLEE